MTPEKQVYVYSNLALGGMINLILSPFLIRYFVFLAYFYKHRDFPLMNKEESFERDNGFQNVFFNITLIVACLSFIASIVFYSLAMTKIKKIKKNAYYRPSVTALTFTSLFYLSICMGIAFNIGLKFIK